MMSEIWKDIPGYEGLYQVSNTGRARSHHSGEWKLLSLARTGNNYIILALHLNGKRKSYSLHQLVAELFLSERPDGHQVNHIDGDKCHNAASNLEWATPSENSCHAIEMGLTNAPHGEAHWNSKLTAKQVREIRHLYAKGNLFQREIAAFFGVSRGAIAPIVRGVHWRHVK